jgi:hypothetical protein
MGLGMVKRFKILYIIYFIVFFLINGCKHKELQSIKDSRDWNNAMIENNITALENLFKLFYKKQKFDQEGIKIYLELRKKAVELNPTSQTIFLYGKSLFYFNKNSKDKAIKYICSAIRHKNQKAINFANENNISCKNLENSRNSGLELSF